MSEQIARDAEVVRIHAKEELRSMIDGLDRNNETIVKYLQEYQQFAAELPLERRIELISDLGMIFEEVEAKFNSVYKQMEDFIPMGSKEEAKRYKRKAIRFDQESSKKLKSSEEVIEEAKSTDEIPKEKIKEMMQLIPIEEVYIEALQVKHLIIDWKVHKEGQRSYWKIIRLGGSSACYQFFVDLLKHLDRDDLNQLWILVKEYLSIKPASSDKEMELWVELKRLYEPDPEDQLWAQTQNFMHAPIEWMLYDLSGVHQVTTKDKEIFMLVEKDYPLRKGLALGRIVGNKMHKAFPLLVRKFPLLEGTSHYLKKNATARRKVFPLPKVFTAIIVKEKPYGGGPSFRIWFKNRLKADMICAGFQVKEEVAGKERVQYVFRKYYSLRNLVVLGSEGARNAISLGRTILGYYPVRLIPSKTINVPTCFSSQEDEAKPAPKKLEPAAAKIKKKEDSSFEDSFDDDSDFEEEVKSAPTKKPIATTAPK
nr:hypothetical protein [Tanacetum cinerariifolium]